MVSVASIAALTMQVVPLAFISALVALHSIEMKSLPS
jgi:hypothetical protein